MDKGSSRKKGGFSLVEVVVSVLVLVVLALGGAAMMYHTGANIKIQGNRRVALELANKRMEIVRAQFYYAIAPDAYGAGNMEYLKPKPSSKPSGEDDPYLLIHQKQSFTETTTLQGINYLMRTEIVRWDPDDANSPYPDFNPECIGVTVRVAYRNGTADSVELKTALLPPQVLAN